jgi:cytochrome b
VIVSVNFARFCAGLFGCFDCDFCAFLTVLAARLGWTGHSIIRHRSPAQPSHHLLGAVTCAFVNVGNVTTETTQTA